MEDDELERAVAAALRAGRQTPQEIARYVDDWLAPIVHVEMLEPTLSDRAAGLMSIRLAIAKPSGSIH